MFNAIAENRAESTANAKYCKNLPGKSTRNSVFLNQFGKLDDTCSTCSTFIHLQTRSLGNELEVAEWLRLRFLAVLHLCKAGDDFRRMPQLDEPWKSWLFVCAWTDCYKASICCCIVMFFLVMFISTSFEVVRWFNFLEVVLRRHMVESWNEMDWCWEYLRLTLPLDLKHNFCVLLYNRIIIGKKIWSHIDTVIHMKSCHIDLWPSIHYGIILCQPTLWEMSYERMRRRKVYTKALAGKTGCFHSSESYVAAEDHLWATVAVRDSVRD